ncbi:protein SGT1 homolog [Alnus glutinosa]|uniref:protein SGT1 homolog n=1 Tax=Alnus glutinosa TaxID=3517 RepID=UPI002D77B88B|nr:protein SGT1 homolog [Alnus glutinosa]
MSFSASDRYLESQKKNYISGSVHATFPPLLLALLSRSRTSTLRNLTLSPMVILSSDLQPIASELAEKAQEAFLDDNFQLAVDLYTQAIDLTPNDANLFADRSQTHLKLNKFTEAVADADRAIQINPSMAKAYQRKGTAYIKLGDYHTAKATLEIGASLLQNDFRFIKLIKECDQHITDVCAEETTRDLPPSAEPTAVASELSDETVVTLEKFKEGDNTSQQMSTITPVIPKYRHEYYQKAEEVVVTIFAKGVPANSVVVDFGEQVLSVTIDVPGDDAYNFQRRLFGKILPEKCRYVVLSTKVEIRLVKAECFNWPSLEYSKEIAVSQKVNDPSVGSQRPAYPSSMPRKKDWDKLESQLKKEEKEEKLDGDAAVNKLFRDIYQSSDEDMRRAMSKSFVESNGTVLSTDWKEVGSKKVEGSAPEGMELKKWEY